MGQRGRRSSASLAVVSPAGVIEVRRPGPPEDLSAEQAHEWRAVVNNLAADWFGPETYPLLTAYCRHVVSARRVAQLIASAESSDDFSVEDYDRLLKMQERESRTLAMLATKMRVSQQSTNDPDRKKKPKSASRPWEDI